MKTIWKYQITENMNTVISIPKYKNRELSDQVLYCAVQHGVPCLWVAVDTEMPSRPVHIMVAGTGHPLDDMIGMIHVGSFMLLNERFVGHVFVEEKE